MDFKPWGKEVTRNVSPEKHLELKKKSYLTAYFLNDDFINSLLITTKIELTLEDKKALKSSLTEEVERLSQDQNTSFELAVNEFPTRAKALVERFYTFSVALDAGGIPTLPVEDFDVLSLEELPQLEEASASQEGGSVVPHLDPCEVQPIENFLVSVLQNIPGLLSQANITSSRDTRIKARDLLVSREEELLRSFEKSGDTFERVVIDFLRNNKDFLERQD